MPATILFHRRLLYYEDNIAFMDFPRCLTILLCAVMSLLSPENAGAVDEGSYSHVYEFSDAAGYSDMILSRHADSIIKNDTKILVEKRPHKIQKSVCAISHKPHSYVILNELRKLFCVQRE